MMPASKKSQSGFTLVELLVAVMILAVGLLGLAQLQVSAIKANSQSATTTAATAIAQRYIERITAMDPADAMFNADGTGTFPPVTVEGGGIYNVTWTVETPYESVTNLCKVTIFVESTTDVMGVLGNNKRTATMRTLKRAI
jgi:prepilin-type N-terminal cleavage/methylation domain-containing protein